MKFSALFIAAFALVNGVAAVKSCCCVLAGSESNCDCVSGYADNTNCGAICRTRGDATGGEVCNNK